MDFESLNSISYQNIIVKTLLANFVEMIFNTPKRLFEKRTAIAVQCYTDSVRMSAKQQRIVYGASSSVT